MATLTQAVRAWVLRRQGRTRGAVSITRKRIYILPTGYGYIFALMLLVMLVWAINSSNSMGYALTFLLSAVGVNAMWRSHANLLELRVSHGTAEPVFAGQVARFDFSVENPTEEPRYGIALELAGGSDLADVPAEGNAVLTVAVPALARGKLRPGRVTVSTTFPLGLFRAWSWMEFEHGCLVYPHPRGHQPLPTEQPDRAQGCTGRGGGSDDFGGLRPYVPGDSPRHVAWKASARSPDLMVKQFTGQARHELWLDWDLVPSASVETRLCQLCQWVLKAESQSWEYGLRIPGKTLTPASGRGHRRRCLEALALCALPREAPDG